MNPWTFNDIPDQAGRTAIVTGANAGIGLEAARMLALKGAEVLLACRNPAKGEAARARILAESPRGSVTLAALDLADLDSVATFASKVQSTHKGLDLLINNAGVMVPPFGRTRQGFELQFGTNHLGHFALTAHLLPLLDRTPGARVVVVSSSAQNMGRIDFQDLYWERRPYRAWLAYGQSKLANMLFALELSRRLAKAGSAVKVTASHPGWTATELQRSTRMRFMNGWFAMTPADGALTTLRAAVDPEAASGSYWGPSGFMGVIGSPALARPCRAARDEEVAARLWEASERLTGVTLAIPDGSAQRG